MKEDGGPAFPNVIEYVPEHERERYCEKYKLVGGMTLRDWFAGQALAGCQRIMESGDDYFTSDTPEVIAMMAYKLADAMLAERSERKAQAAAIEKERQEAVAFYMHDPLACTPDEEMS